MIRKLNTGPVSPPKYLKSGRARTLPLYECYMPSDWKEMGKFPVLISRMHSNGNVTAAVLLVDILCTGMKDAFFIFNEPEHDFQDLVEKYAAIEDLQLVDYNLVHNVVFGALEFAGDYGIKPPKDWELVSMILEKDDDHIPFMEIPLGEDDKPVLLYSSEDPRADYYLRQLEIHAGEDFLIINQDEILSDNELHEGEEEVDDTLFLKGYENWDKEEWRSFMEEVDTESLSAFDPIYGYIYEKLEYEPLLAAGEFNDLELSDDFQIEVRPIEGDEFLQLEEVHAKMEGFYLLNDDSSDDEHAEVIAQLEEAVKMWPDQPRLYDSLAIAYAYTEDYTKAEEVNREARKKFIKHFTGKLVHAKLLLQQERLDEIEAALGGLTPRKILEGYNSLSIREYMPFLSLLGIYFLKKEDVPRAHHISRMVNELDFDQALERDKDFDFLMLLHRVGLVNLMIREMQENEKKLEEAVAVLIV